MTTMLESIKDQLGIDLKSMDSRVVSNLCVHCIDMNPYERHEYVSYMGSSPISSTGVIDSVTAKKYALAVFNTLFAHMPCFTHMGARYVIDGLPGQTDYTIGFTQFMLRTAPNACWDYRAFSVDIGDGVNLRFGYLQADQDFVGSISRVLAINEESSDPYVRAMIGSGDNKYSGMFHMYPMLSTRWDTSEARTRYVNPGSWSARQGTCANLVWFGAIPAINVSQYEFADVVNYNVYTTELEGFARYGKIELAEHYGQAKLSMPVWGFVPSEEYIGLLNENGFLYKIDEHGFLESAKHQDSSRVFVPFALVPCVSKEIDACISGTIDNMNKIHGLDEDANVIINEHAVVDYITHEARNVLEYKLNDVSNMEENYVSTRERISHDLKKVETHLGLAVLSVEDRIKKVEDALAVVETFEKVNKVFIDGTKLRIILNPLVAHASNGRNGEKFDFQLGKIMITYDLENDSILFSGMTLARDRVHPHVSSDGGACFGTVMTRALEEAEHNFELPMIVMLLIQYLEQANLSDDWGKIAYHFPRVEK